MNIIYCCSGGTHSSIVAAFIHLGKLPTDRLPEKDEILNTPFDTIEPHEVGRIIYRGTDEFQNKVFTLSKKNAGEIVIPALMDLNRILGSHPDNLQIANTHTAVNLLMKIGGFTSRGLGLISIGRPIVLKGTYQTYNNLVDIVKSVKHTINDISAKD